MTISVVRPFLNRDCLFLVDFLIRQTFTALYSLECEKQIDKSKKIF